MLIATPIITSVAVLRRWFGSRAAANRGSDPADVASSDSGGRRTSPCSGSPWPRARSLGAEPRDRGGGVTAPDPIR